ncbi:MAG TPA: oxygenase MpaB family protein [Microlunatus sp.]
MHPERRRRTAALAELAEHEQWELLYQRLMLQEFPYEARMGWQLAFLRTFSSPRMAELLVGTGQLIGHTRKRANDTGLMIYEIVHGGFDSPRTRQAISGINRAHRPLPLLEEDLTYVLCAFIVTPLRHIERVGWRAVTEAERESAVLFFGHLGRLMNIAVVPATYAEAVRLYDAYENAHVGPSSAAHRLAEELVAVLEVMQPWVSRPLAAPVFTLLLGDRRISHALGLWVPSVFAERVTRVVLRAYGQIKRQSRPDDATKVFTPGMAVEGVYPHGYRLSDLGAPDLRSGAPDEPSS